jgi:hypothetical protein
MLQTWAGSRGRAGRMLPICVEGRRYVKSEIEEQHKPRWEF